MKLSIIIPVYFNEGTLYQTFKKILSVISSSEYITNYEFIFVDDGSKDHSLFELLQIQKENNHVKIIKFSRNFGQVPAIYAGYQHASGDLVVTLSADLQDPPELIVKMIEAYVNKEAEIVVCSRMDREEGLFRKTTSKIFYKTLKKLSFSNMPIRGFDYVLISRKVIEKLNQFKESNIFWQGQLLWFGYPVKFIPYVRRKREIGISRWTFQKKIKYLLDGILGYSYFPIRLISIMGILVFFIGIIYSIILTINYFFGDIPFKGWTPIMVVILLLSGFQMLMLGVIGEYLWRTLEQTRKRPLYNIDEIYE